MLLLNKNIATSLITHNLSQIINITTHFIILRSIISEEYGLYVYYSLIIDLVILFFGSSIIQSGIAVKGVVGIYSNILFQILIINLIIIFFSFIFIYLIYEGDFKLLLSLLLISRSCGVIGAVNLSMVYDRQGKFVRSSSVRLLASIFTIIISIYIVYFTKLKGIFLLTIRDLCNSLVLLIPFFAFAKRFNPKSIRFKTQIKILKYSLNRSVVRISELIFHKSPIFIIEFLFGLKVVGIVSLGIYLITLFTAFFQRLFDIYFVKYIKLSKNLNSDYYTSLNILLIKIVLPFSLILFVQGEYIYNLMYGENWKGYFSTIRFLFLVIPISLIIFNYETFKLSTHQFRNITLGYLSTSALAFILIWICYFLKLENYFISISMLISYITFIIMVHIKNIDLLAKFIDKKDTLLIVTIVLLDFYIFYNTLNIILTTIGLFLIILIYLIFNIKDYSSYYKLIKK